MFSNQKMCIFSVMQCFLSYFQPEIDDYDPCVFLRCHARGNNPADDETKVWKCAFEPQIGGCQG